MIKLTLTIFFVVSIIFSTIYTPQAILPTLKEVFNLTIQEANLLLFGMLFILMIATPFYAPIIKKFDKKKIMVVSTFFLFLAVIISSISTNYYTLLFSRILQGIFIPGITATMLVYIQEVYPKKHIGLGIGIYMSATSFGAVIGRLLAGWITYKYSWNIAFSVFAGLLFVAFILMIIGFPSSENKLKIERNDTKNKNIFTYIFNKQIISILLIPMAVFFSFMAITTFITYKLHLAPFELNDAQIGNIFLVLLVAIFISPLAGRYSDKIGRIRIIYLGIFSLIIGIILTMINIYFIILIGLSFVTIGMFSIQSVTPAYLGDIVPNDKSTLAVLYQVFFYFGGAMGTILPILLWNSYGYNGVALFCIILIMLIITIFIYLQDKINIKYNNY